MLTSCTNKKEPTENIFTLEIEKNCTDSLFLNNNSSSYYHCGIGVTFDVNYTIDKNLITAKVYDYQFQYKESKKIPIAEFSFHNERHHLILDSIKYLHHQYKGECSNLRTFYIGQITSKLKLGSITSKEFVFKSHRRPFSSS